ncbi:MAG: hydrogenase maturation nickel metallochaperone HypA [Spirochaetota bacterium]
MHEAVITRSIMDTVLETVRKERITGTVVSVRVTAGVCQGLVPESMQMYFDMEKPGTPLKNAELIVETQRMAAFCPACEKEYTLDEPVMFCPDCGGIMKLLKGTEILVASIEVEETI